MNTAGKQTAVPPTLPTDSKDIAWVSVPALQSPDELAVLCRNIETLFRINPYYYFSTWTETGPGVYRAEFDNQSNQQHISVDFDVVAEANRCLAVKYRNGLKKKTYFRIEAFGEGSRLIVADDYEGLTAEERQARLSEVDKSLQAWGESLRLYFHRVRRWSWLPGWRWYIRRFWLPMKPSSRRIVWLLYLITAVEFLFFLFVLLIYLIEQNKAV